MPLTKIPKKREPLWKEWNYNADKRGVRNTFYAVNGDQYTGEWENNKKNGMKYKTLIGRGDPLPPGILEKVLPVIALLIARKVQ